MWCILHCALMHMARGSGLSTSPEALLAAAQSRVSAGDVAGAEDLLRQVPKQGDVALAAARLQGVCRFAQGDHDGAARFFARVLKAATALPMDHVNLGLALAGLARWHKAEACYRKAIALDPGFGEAWFNLGNLLRETGKLEAASQAYTTVTELAPQDPRPHFNLGFVRAARHLPLQAIESFEAALKLAPDLVDAHNEIGLAHAAMGDQEKAEVHYRQLLAVKPNHSAALANLGAALAARRRFDAALPLLDRASRQPDCPAEALSTYGDVLLRVRKTREGEAVLRRALALKPDHGDALAALAMILQWQCRWDELDDIRPKLIAMSLRAAREGRRSPVAPHTALSQGLNPAEEKLIAESWSRHQSAQVQALAGPQRFSYLVRAREKIRLGYFSNDFNSQATAHLIVGLFEQHDRDRFEVYAYSFGADDGSSWRKRIEAASDRFVDVTQEGYGETAARMNRDEVDILLDFKGFTAESRPQVYAFHPAPIQVNYLGFPGTIGADYMDYLIADEIVIPPDEREHYTEKIVYLPECYQANDNQQSFADWPATRADVGLPETGIVFSCFNETYKIDRTIFTVWMRILARVPDSVLWLRDQSPALQTGLRAAAQAAGVSGDRIVFAALLPKEQHLARCRLADVFLDSYALTAHTTATDSLWAGVPVLTCPRNTFATRVGKSLLTNLNLPELIVPDLAAYEDMAVNLASRPDALAAIRARLADNLHTAPLFDTPRLTRHLEGAFSGMWERYLAGRPAESFRVPALS